MDKYKIIIKKIVLFIMFTILLMILYYKVIPNFNKYGAEIFNQKDYIKTKAFQKTLQKEIQALETNISFGIELDYYNEANFSSHNGTLSNLRYILDIEKTNGETMLLSNVTEEKRDTEEKIKNFKKNKIYYKCALNEYPETNQEELQYYQFCADQNVFKKLDVYVMIDNIEKQDELYMEKENYESIAKNIRIYICACIILSIVFILLLINLTKHKNEYKSFSYFSKLYIEQILVIFIITIYFTIQAIAGIRAIGTLDSKSIKWIIYIIGYTIISELYFYIIKEKQNKKGSLIVKTIKNFQNTYKTIILYFLAYITPIILLKAFNVYDYYIEQISIDMMIIYVIVLLHQLNLLEEVNEINNKVKMMEEGDLNITIKHRNDELKELVENINHINQGMKKAVEERVKTERLKTDLITNVSHDLKTPLTSIINYTDLLKKEKIENENAKKYIKILEEKSKKLKNLTEDLIETSKISSGNEVAKFEKLDFREMILQANGEFAEKFEEKNLEIVSDLPKEALILELDGKKMWRVLENLYQNIYKHSLENTRVYVDLKSIKEESEEIITLKIKNISKEKLNISPDELMERFIMGDNSRHTGGNGLGLSISKDLTRLNNGKLTLQIEADLFIAKIEFKK